MPVHLLQTHDVRVLVLDDIDDPFQAISAVAPANAFVDVVAQEPH